jgi:2,3-dihydroxyphenylpropionate 1,2-dioxygenase
MPLRMICASHTPLMDHVATDPVTDREVRSHFAALADEVRRYDPELIIVFGPDHFKGFFYDVLPPFTIGIRAKSIGDYGIGGGDFNVPEELALECARYMLDHDVDIAVSYRMQADHGFAQIPVLLTGSVAAYPTIPIHINCAGTPLPSFRRVREMGRRVGCWAESLGKRVLILGSGGLSHDPPMPTLHNAPPRVEEMLIGGRSQTPEALLAREEAVFDSARKLARGEGQSRPLNATWDKAFMAQMASGDFDTITLLGEDELTAIAGCGGHEVRNWVAAYAAQAAAGPADHEKVFYKDIAEWNAGMGIATAYV